MGVLADAANLPGGLAVGQQDQPPIPQGQSFANYQNADAVTQEGVDQIATQGQMSRGANPTAAFHKVVYETGPDGQTNISVKMPQTTFDTLSQLMQTGQATISAFDQARQQLAAKQQFLQQNPIVAGLGSIFSSAAAQYAGGPHQAGRIAPLVRAAGAYGLQTFGQTPEALQQEQAQLQGQSFQVARELQGETDKQTALGQQADAQAIEQQNQKITLGRQAASDLEHINDNYRTIAQRGAVTPTILANYQKEMIAKGATPETAAAGAQNLADESKQVADKANLVTKEVEQNGRTYLKTVDTASGQVKTAVDIGPQKVSATQEQANLDKAEKKKTMRSIAQGIADGDPTSLNIYGTRSSTADRAELYGMVKAINPKLGEADINARVKAVQSLGSREKGSFGGQLQSLDVFAQHSGEVLPLIDKLGNTQSPLLNTPIDKMSAAVKGDPNVAPVLVAVAQVGKEYESFLNNGFALQAEDRKQVEQLLSGNMNLNQARAALQQFLRTAKDRYSSLDNQYHRTTGRHLPSDSLSDDARNAAQSVGVTLPDYSAPTKALDLSKYDKP